MSKRTINTQMLACSDCGLGTRAGGEAESVVCGSCVQCRCAGSKRTRDAQLAVYTPESVQEFRAQRGITQTDLAQMARVRVSDVRYIEQDRGLINEKLARYIDKQEEAVA